MSVVYGIMFVVAIVLLVAHILLLRKRDPWLLLMYGCIVVVNFGYLLLSLSKTVEFALFANKVAYLGSVYLCMCMFLTIVRLCGFKYKKRLPIAFRATVSLFSYI